MWAEYPDDHLNFRGGREAEPSCLSRVEKLTIFYVGSVGSTKKVKCGKLLR